MRPERVLTVVLWVLWALVVLAIVLLLSSCRAEQRVLDQPLVLEGGIQCAPRGGVIFCAVHLEQVPPAESVDE